MVRKACRLLFFVLFFGVLVSAGNANAQTISDQEIIDAANSAIRQYTGADADISVSLIGTVRDMQVPDGNLEITASIPSGVRYNTQTLVYVNAAVDGQTVSRTMLHFQVRMYQNVVVAARNLPIRQVLCAEDLRYERLDTGRLPTGFITNIDKAIGQQVSNFMRPGMVLTDFSLRKPVIIKRGSTVNIVARSGRLEVSAVGIAMQDGTMGQIIRVQNANSRKFVSGVVMDDANVLAALANGK